MSTATKPKAPAPRASRPAAPAAPSAAPTRAPQVVRETRKFSVSRGTTTVAHKTVIYGPGGIGKTELCSLLANVGIEPLFVDIENSSGFLDVARFDPAPETFDDVRDALHSEEVLQAGAVIVDSLSKLEELARDFVIRTVPHEKGAQIRIRSIEDYGWGKGYTHLYEVMMLILQDLDAIARRGVHVFCVCHDCTEKVPNPAGEDFLQWQPRLQSPAKQGKLRERVKEWCDHLLYIGWDRFVDDSGKASGSGSRTIYPIEMPTHWAKSRVLDEPIEYLRGDAEVWRKLFGE
jgi:hypothetical protein